ncbi:MAG TPA: beta-ketoacyl-[acyl-carrier-protein] synthase family protein [Thermoanaerobaculia bacterium]|nr:beta-ketoacyl-[acyl-carrier-protein] synthase family protein [Thermoanaerobaculia bacterium]
MTDRRVVVTGLGVVSPHGSDPAAMFSRLMSGESAIRAVSFEAGGSYSNVAAPVDFDFDLVRHLPPHVRLENLDRVTQMSIVAASGAIADAGIVVSDELRDRSGVSFGTGMGSTSSLEETHLQVFNRDPARVRPLTVLKVMNNASAGHIAIKYGLGGPDLTYSCACSSSAVAIGEAYRQIRHGYADVMIAGGAEAPLSYTFFRSWDAMHVLAPINRENPSATCRPFAKDRSGLVLSEGAAMVVLEEREQALSRGAKVYAELVGYGLSNEYAHITKPSVEGQARAIELALADRGTTRDEIDYVNAHGTGTAINDPTETRALKRVFGDRASKIPVSSTKSMHGHLLGGAGALEFVISVLALTHCAVPPTANLEQFDPECDLDYVPLKGRFNVGLRSVMSNSFAFGGTNAVLIAQTA